MKLKPGNHKLADRYYKIELKFGRNSQGYWGAPTVPDSDLHSPPSDFDPMNNLSQGNAAPSNFFFLGENFLQENMHDDSGFATSSFETVSQGLDNSVPFFPNFLPETEATPAFDGNNSGIWWNYNDLFVSAIK